jgi:hypothetical protein
MSQVPDVDDLADYQAKDAQQALDAALATVRSHCRWHIAPSQSDTAVVWSAAGGMLWLPTRYLTAVTSITQDGATVAPTSYTFETHGVVRRNYGAYFNTLTKVTVAFTHGYATMPGDVSQVVLSLAQRSISDTRGLVATATGVSRVETYEPQLTDGDLAKLAPYVIPDGFGA